MRVCLKTCTSILVVGSFSFIIVEPAYAYIDPGTGSMMIQAIIALITAMSVFVGMFWGRVKMFLNNVFGKKHVTGDQHKDEHE